MRHCGSERKAVDQAWQFGAPFPGKFGANLLFKGVQPVAVEVQDRWRVNGDLGGASGGEDAEERVVVLLRDGIELVIVATGAGDGEALESFGKDVDLVVSPFDAILPGVNRLEAMFHHAPMSKGQA